LKYRYLPILLMMSIVLSSFAYSSTETIIVQNTGGGFENWGKTAGGDHDIFEQSFTLSKPFSISSIELNFSNSGYVTVADYWIAIVKDSGGSVTNNLVDVNSNITINISRIVANENINFTFDNDFEIEGGSYHILLGNNEEVNGNDLLLEVSQNDAAYGNGTLSRSENGGAFIGRIKDLRFVLYGLVEDNDITTQFDDNVLENSLASINMTIDSTNVNATLFYNNTPQGTATISSVNSTHTKFSNIITTPKLSQDVNISFRWIYNIFDAKTFFNSMTNIVSYWPMDYGTVNTSGLKAEDIISGNNGTLTGYSFNHGQYSGGGLALNESCGRQGKGVCLDGLLLSKFQRRLDKEGKGSVFVEKNRFRIDSIGELSGIQKKGARSRKKKFGVFL